MVLPNIPIDEIEDPTSADLTDEDNIYPLRDEIVTQDSVGPEAANRQPKALDLRTETLRETVNILVETVNALHDNLLHRDGINSEDNTDPPEGPLPTPSYMRAALSMTDPAANGGLGQAYQVKDVFPGTEDEDAAIMSQLNAALASLGVLQGNLGDYIRRDGTVPMTGNLNLAGRNAINSADPVNASDGVTKNYADPIFSALQTGYFKRDGSLPMQAALDMGSNRLINMPTTVPPDDDMSVSRRYILDVLAALAPAPTACVMPLASGIVPAGWLLCDGAAVSRTTYNTLFAAIGTTYGVGDGSTTFNLPDLRARTMICLDDLGTAEGAANVITDAWADTLGGTGGAATHTLIVDELPSHQHSYADAYSATGNTGSFFRPSATASDGDTLVTDARNTATAGTDQAHQNVQPSMAFNMIIKS